MRKAKGTLQEEEKREFYKCETKSEEETVSLGKREQWAQKGTVREGLD